MVFRVTKTTFGPTPQSAGSANSGDPFVRSVSNRTVSYTTYLAGAENKVFKLEFLAGEQFSTSEVFEEGDIEVYFTPVGEQKLLRHEYIEGLNRALFVLQEFVRHYRRRIVGGVKSIRFVTYEPKIDIMLNQFIDSSAFGSIEKKLKVLAKTNFDRIENKRMAKKVNRVFAESVISRIINTDTD